MFSGGAGAIGRCTPVQPLNGKGRPPERKGGTRNIAFLVVGYWGGGLWVRIPPGHQGCQKPADMENAMAKPGMSV